MEIHPEDDREQVSRILEQADGDAVAAVRSLEPVVYRHLRELARRRMAKEPAEHTLQPTALVHEAYVKLVGRDDIPWHARSRFFAAASEAMRRVLLDHARRRRSQKRGAGKRGEAFDEALDGAVDIDLDEVLMLDEALARLQAEDPRAAEVVRLRFYGGLDIDETAAALGLSRRTVLREWTWARARLQQLLGGDG